MLLGSACSAQDAFGTWKMNPARSTFVGDPHPRAITVRIEPHAKGQTFTFDRIRSNGQATTFSIILYMDGKDRDFHGAACSGSGFSSDLTSAAFGQPTGRAPQVFGIRWPARVSIWDESELLVLFRK